PALVALARRRAVFPRPSGTVLGGPRASVWRRSPTAVGSRSLRPPLMARALACGLLHMTRLLGTARAAARLEARHGAVLDLAVDQPFDRGHQRAFFGAHQRHRLAFHTRAAGAADAMHVILGDVRQVVVD